jgi:hypothetical protein
MKTVKQGKEVKRVSDSDAEIMIKKGGWAYCPKSEWKSKVRDAGKVSKEEKFSKVNSKSDKGERRTKKDEKKAGKEKSEKRQSKYRQKKESAEG